MTHLRRMLVMVVLLEVIAGAIAIGWKLLQPRPPLADLSCVDSLTAADLRSRAATTYSLEDWRSLGESYMATGFFREAEACHRIAAARDRNNARLAWQAAFALERLGKLAAANDEYRRAGVLDPASNAACQYAIGRNLLRANQVAEATESFVRAGDLPAAQYERARIAYRAEDFTTATAIAAQLTAEQPDAQEPRRLAYKIALRQSDADSTRRHVRDQYAASQLLPTPMDGELLRLRARAQNVGFIGLRTAAQREFEAGRFPAAEKKLKAVLEAQFDMTAADLMAEVEFYQGRQRESARRIQQILELGGPAIERFERLGDTNSALRLKNNAQAAWSRAANLAFGPPTRGAHRKLALWYESNGQVDLAKRHFAWEALAAGIIELDAGNASAASAALQAAVAANPELAAAWFYLGEAASSAGDLEQARRAYEQCLAVRPQHGRASDRLAGLQD